MPPSAGQGYYGTGQSFYDLEWQAAMALNQNSPAPKAAWGDQEDAQLQAALAASAVDQDDARIASALKSSAKENSSSEDAALQQALMASLQDMGASTAFGETKGGKLWDERTKLRSELPVLAPIIRAVFPDGRKHDLPDPRCSYAVPIEDDADEQATKYIVPTLEKFGAHHVLPLQTTGDGNCLLHAASRAVWGVELFSNLLKSKMVTELEDHKDWYIEHIGKEEWKVAHTRASGKSEYLSSIHVVALSHVLRRPIAIFASEEDMMSLGCGEGGVSYFIVPVRYAAKELVCRRLIALSWQTAKHTHYVALVWPSSEAPPRWPVAKLAEGMELATNVDKNAAPFYTSAWQDYVNLDEVVVPPDFVSHLVNRVRELVDVVEAQLIAGGPAAVLTPDVIERILPPELCVHDDTEEGQELQQALRLSLQPPNGPTTEVELDQRRHQMQTFHQPRERGPGPISQFGYCPAESSQSPSRWAQVRQAFVATARSADIGTEVHLSDGGSQRMCRNDNIFALAKETGSSLSPVELIARARELKAARRDAEVQACAHRIQAASGTSSGSSQLLNSRRRVGAEGFACLAITGVRLASELRLLQKKPIEGVKVTPIKGTFHWKVSMPGVTVVLRFPSNYPEAPPVVLLQRANDAVEVSIRKILTWDSSLCAVDILPKLRDWWCALRNSRDSRESRDRDRDRDRERRISRSSSNKINSPRCETGPRRQSAQTPRRTHRPM